ncbi:baculoviral IAP repeat-containing protein 1-like [Pelodytes ibericus]
MASGDYRESTNEKMDVMNIKEFDPEKMEKTMSFLNIDFRQCAAEENKKHAAIRQQLGKRYNFEMRSEARRLKSFHKYKKLSSWCPKLMAKAGFFFTGVDLSVQCFCCGLVFCTTSVRTPPYEDHVKHNPACGFIQGRDVGNIPKYEVRVQLPENGQGERKEFISEKSRLTSFASWPFYNRIQPDELTRAGFFFTGTRDTVQCFSCGGCLGNWLECDDPWREHAKWFPECKFIGTNKTPDEIQQYIKSYNGFSGFTGKHFSTRLHDRIFPTKTRCPNFSIFQDEDVRLDSFSRWPENAHVYPADLARVGFYYTGILDKVKCFACGITLYLFEPGDDPYTEHVKHSSACEFLQKYTNKNDKEMEHESVNNILLYQASEMTASNPVAIFPARRSTSEEAAGDEQHPGADLPTECWVREAANLKCQLMNIYSNSFFSKVSPFPESSHVSVDLKSLFADISVVLKDTRNHPVQQLTLPDILCGLSDITMIEGEVGSGKSALLQKIAILWASGTCPILSRFSHVFYISVSSSGNHQTLSDIITKQLLGSTTPLTEETLEEIINHLGNQTLFLIDGYGEMDSIPESIEKLFLNNLSNRVSLAATVLTGTGRKLRQYARTVLSIQEFPLYSSIYIYRQLFSHDLAFVEAFLVNLISSNALQGILSTPLFTFALCVQWVKNPNEKTTGDVMISKAYLIHSMRRLPQEKDRVKAVVSSCGELALSGLFQFQFDFTDEDLCAAGVSSGDAVTFGLLSKFTSQRLYPIYSFFHPSFQEFLAGQRISDLLDSSDKVLVEHGMYYLQQINTFIRMAGRYHYFLKYSCMHSSKTTCLVISHLFNLLNNSDAYECQAETSYFQHHPDLACIEEMMALMSSNNRGARLQFAFYMLLDFAIKVAQESNSMAECAPIILTFLHGKDLTLDLASPNVNLCGFLKEFPEVFSLIGSLKLSVFVEGKDSNLDFVHCDKFASYWDVPLVEQDYAAAFQLSSNTFQKNNPSYSHHRRNVDMSNFGFNQGAHKISVLKVEACGHIKEWSDIICNLLVFLPLSDHVELTVTDSPGFVGCIRICIEQYKDKFRKCTFYKAGLNAEEQALICQMLSLQCLQITDVHLPDHLILHLDGFSKLEELTMKCLSGEWEVISILPEGFGNLLNLKRIELNDVDLRTHSSQLAEFIGNFSNLTSFCLTCNCCPEFKKIMTSVSGKIQQIQLSGLFLTDKEIMDLAAVLPTLTHLKVLVIEGKQCVNVEALNIFVRALPSLVHLEELELPSGPATNEVAGSFIKSFRHLRKLKKVFLTHDVLNDSSLIELAKEAKEGNLSNLQELHLEVNNDITQSGWREFFLTLDNLPHLNELCITRIYSHQFKTDPLTLIALVQCVARLHSLNKLVMHGWLLDEKDLEMFNAMKQKHPQGKGFMLLWQWLLPFRPIVSE